MADKTHALRDINEFTIPVGMKDSQGDESKYSVEAYLTGGSVNLESGDIEIGAVEIKDGDSNTRLDVESVTSKNAAYTQSEAGAHADIVDIKTAVETIDDMISGNEGQVDIVTQPAAEQTTPTFYNKTLAVADTEEVQALPANTRALQFQCRTAYDIRYAFETGKVETPTSPYSTLKSGAVWYKENILSSGSLYLASSEAGVVVEIETWT